MERSEQPDFVVVGTGIAGLRAAISLAANGTVLVISKERLTESNTQYAQGGIAVALSDDDVIDLHLQDTIDAGDGLVDEKAARVLVTEGPARIQELIDWGTEFDRSGSKLIFTREAAHSRSRVLHAHGDSTGREIARSLAAKAQSIHRISFADHSFTVDLLSADGEVCGVRYLDSQGHARAVTSRAVLLATGGAGQVYSDTTNPSVATGDGIGMAVRAGAALSDMEFFQFHPTALFVPGAPRFLLSEALRGEGAYLRNRRGERFMVQAHPMAELAPRDVVARTIAREILADPSAEAAVFLDARHLAGNNLPARFPQIYATCGRYGLDLAADLIPVRPAAHYLMGGIRTDLEGRSSLRGLYAAGEVACTGVHGANRLASNSLLEGLVFGARAARAMAADWLPIPSKLPDAKLTETADRLLVNSQHDPGLRSEIQRLMWTQAGILRSGSGLRKLQASLNRMNSELPELRSRLDTELHNLHATATAIAICALEREESRGAHYRTDFPRHDDARFRSHSVLRHGKVTFAAEASTVSLH